MEHIPTHGRNSTHKRTKYIDDHSTVAACAKHSQDQVSYHSNIDGEKTSPLDEALLALMAARDGKVSILQSYEPK